MPPEANTISMDPALFQAWKDLGNSGDETVLRDRLARAAALFPDADPTGAEMTTRVADGQPVLPRTDGETLIVPVDPEAQRFATPGDTDAYDGAVADAFRSGQPGSQFETYRADIERFNALERAVQWYRRLPVRNTGHIVLRLAKGLHRVWGATSMTGLLSGVALEGPSVASAKVVGIAFGASTRGDDWSEATLSLEAALHGDVVVGMAFGSAEIASPDTDHGSASEVVRVTDHAAFLNGAHIITSIAADRKSVTVDVPHTNGSTQRLVAPTQGFPDLGTLFIPLAQIAFTGGFDGRRDEAFLRPQYGSNVEYARIGLVDHTDPAITRGNGYAPDRKNVFAANIAGVMFRDRVVCAGAEGHVFRGAKMVTVTANRSYFGAAGLRTRAGRVFYVQLNCQVDLTRCAFSGGRDYNLLATSDSSVIAQGCISVNSGIGAYALTASHLNLQNFRVFGCGTGVRLEDASRVVLDSNTVIENCLAGVVVGKTATLVERGTVKHIGNGADVDDQRTPPSRFRTDVTIDKPDAALRLHHTIFEGYVMNDAGQFRYATARNVHRHRFGYTDDGAFIETLNIDPVRKAVVIDGDEVLRARGAAIADPSADAESLRVAVTAILSRMRAATPSIAT